MKELSGLKLALKIGVCLMAMLMTLSSALAAEKHASSKQASLGFDKHHLCVKKNIDPISQQCADLIKQSQLETVKLSPQVRASDIKQDISIHLTEFSPFIGGVSGQVD